MTDKRQTSLIPVTTKAGYCDAFMKTWGACNLKCKYYRECITYENFMKPETERP